MQIEKVKLDELKSNLNNPRIIKDDKFKKLVKSIKEFPEMLEIRPIVVDEDMIVLGGNMRLKACKEAGLEEVFIIRFQNLSKNKKDEFIIKDNVGYGEWDFEILNKEWSQEDLLDWGLDIPDFYNLEEDDIEDQNEEKDYNIDSLYQITINFNNEDELKSAYERLIESGYDCKILQI